MIHSMGCSKCDGKGWRIERGFPMPIGAIGLKAISCDSCDGTGWVKVVTQPNDTREHFNGIANGRD